jgi:hypothetical protein
MATLEYPVTGDVVVKTFAKVARGKTGQSLIQLLLSRIHMIHDCLHNESWKQVMRVYFVILTSNGFYSPNNWPK